MGSQDREWDRKRGFKRPNTEDVSSMPDDDSVGTKIAEGTRALHQRIDEALDNYDSQQPTELIGDTAGQHRPEIRTESSEEFLRNFKQKSGQ